MTDNTVNTIVKKLHKLANQEALNKYKHYKTEAPNALGILQRDLKPIIKEIGINTELAQKLYATDIYEAKLIAAAVHNPKDQTIQQMNTWTNNFTNWGICDTTSLKQYAKSEYAQKQIETWHKKNKLYVKRAALSTIAGQAYHNKNANNELFEHYLTIILKTTTDNRDHIKKAANWALRSIGKRNPDLNNQALKLSKQLQKSGHKHTKWIGAHAEKELNGHKTLNYPRHTYLN